MLHKLKGFVLLELNGVMNVYINCYFSFKFFEYSDIHSYISTFIIYRTQGENGQYGFRKV